MLAAVAIEENGDVTAEAVSVAAEVGVDVASPVVVFGTEDVSVDVEIDTVDPVAEVASVLPVVLKALSVLEVESEVGRMPVNDVVLGELLVSVAASLDVVVVSVPASRVESGFVAVAEVVLAGVDVMLLSVADVLVLEPVSVISLIMDEKTLTLAVEADVVAAESVAELALIVLSEVAATVESDVVLVGSDAVLVASVDVDVAGDEAAVPVAVPEPVKPSVVEELVAVVTTAELELVVVVPSVTDSPTVIPKRLLELLAVLADVEESVLEVVELTIEVGMLPVEATLVAEVDEDVSVVLDEVVESVVVASEELDDAVVVSADEELEEVDEVEVEEVESPVAVPIVAPSVPIVTTTGTTVVVADVVSVEVDDELVLEVVEEVESPVPVMEAPNASAKNCAKLLSVCLFRA